MKYVTVMCSDCHRLFRAKDYEVLDLETLDVLPGILCDRCEHYHFYPEQDPRVQIMEED